MTNDLTGVWFGEYGYPLGEAPVSFIASIDDRGGMLAGRIDEPNTFAMPGTARLFAHVRGACRDGIVSLTKTYDGTGGAIHSVAYTGELSADGNTVAGIWRTRGWSGRFTMSRPVVPAAEFGEALENVDE